MPRGDEPITWPDGARIHPFRRSSRRGVSLSFRRPRAVARRHHRIRRRCPLHPNAVPKASRQFACDSQYHESQDSRGATCVSSRVAHGTNAASAAMAGMRWSWSRATTRQRGPRRPQAQGVSTPSGWARDGTLSVQARRVRGRIREICAVGTITAARCTSTVPTQRLVGIARPGRFGADVSHLNLHKTFCIPIGGGARASADRPPRTCAVLPNHPLRAQAGPATGWVRSVRRRGFRGHPADPWMYITMMGADGLGARRKVAILNANYVAHRPRVPLPGAVHGGHGLVAHECIIDCVRSRATRVDGRRFASGSSTRPFPCPRCRSLPEP